MNATDSGANLCMCTSMCRSASLRIEREPSGRPLSPCYVVSASFPHRSGFVLGYLSLSICCSFPHRSPQASRTFGSGIRSFFSFLPEVCFSFEEFKIKLTRSKCCRAGRSGTVLLFCTSLFCRRATYAGARLLLVR